MSDTDDFVKRQAEKQRRLECIAMEVKCLCGCDLCGRRMVDFDGDTPTRPRGVIVQGPDGSYPCCFQCVQAVHAAEQEQR